MQVANEILPLFGFDESVSRIIVIILAIGFIPALIIAWVFELTPDGLARDTGSSVSANPAAAKRLDRVIILVLTVAVVFFAVDRFVLKGSGTEIIETGDRKIVVLPFENLSTDPEKAFFAVGVAGQIRSMLEKVPGMLVTSTGSSTNARKRDLSIHDVADLLGVVFVLDGSVHASGDRVRIALELVDTRTDHTAWSQSYDRTVEDIFAIQDEVAAKVVEELKVEMELGLPPTAHNNPIAYELVEQAKQIVQLDDPARHDESIDLLLRALALQPNYPDANAALALAYDQKARKLLYDDRLEEAKALQAESEARLAMVEEQDPTNVYFNAMRSWNSLMSGDDAAAVRYAEMALERDNRNPAALLIGMIVANMLGDTELSIAIGEFLSARDPLGFWAQSNVGSGYESLGQLDKAIEYYGKAEAASPRAGGIQWKLANVLTMNGQPEKALEHLEREQHAAYRIHGSVLAHFELGELEKSQEFVDQLMSLSAESGGPWPYGYARMYGWLGNADEAIRWMNEALDQGLDYVPDIETIPFFTKIHDDPRWQSIVDRINAAEPTVDFNPKLPPEIASKR